jgi:DNA (cytosine-5)-methyltransferase 1
LENVKAMVEGKFLPMFNLWQAELSRLGYINFAKVLNAKDYGVPQNRERIFLLSIRDDGDSPTYHFPKPFKLDKRLKDVLEQYVDEKYYLSDKLIKSLSRDNGGYKAMKPSEPPYEGTASCLTARMWKMGRSDNYIAVKQVGNIVDDSDIGFKNPQRGRVYSVDGLSPCLNCCEGGGLEPKVIIEGNYSPSKHNASRIINPLGISPTVMENHGTVTAIVESKWRIRKLTPREAFRLMGVDDNDIDAIQATGISNSSQYKLAGNSIVVDVLYHIFRKAFIEKETESQQLTLF